MKKYIVMYYNVSLFKDTLKIVGFYEKLKSAKLKLKELKESTSIIYDSAFIIKLKKAD